MRYYDSGELIPRLTSFVLWERKEQFLYSEYTAQEWVMFIIEEGLIEFEIGGQKGVAGKHDMLVCPPNIPFKRDMVKPATFYFFVFTWTDAEGRMIHDDDQLFPNPMGKCIFHDRYRISSTCHFLSQISGRTDPVSHNRKNALLWDIWQLYSWEQDQIQQHSQRKHKDKLIEQAEFMMQDRAYASFSIKQFAQEIGLSPAQFTRRFKTYFGITPGDYLISLRLNKARELLTETDFTLEHIAKQCGYESGYYLSRVFTKKIKMSPSEYRRTHQL